MNNVTQNRQQQFFSSACCVSFTYVILCVYVVCLHCVFWFVLLLYVIHFLAISHISKKQHILYTVIYVLSRIAVLCFFGDG